MKFMSRFDGFSKAQDHVQQRTLVGGIMSIIALLITFYLFVSEFIYYLTIHRDSHVMVDSATDSNDLSVSIDIEVFAIKCDDAKIQLQNKRGDHIDLTLNKQPSNSENGCRLKGSFDVPRVAGIFQISSKPLSYGSNAFFTMLGLSDNVNASHTVHHLSFGPEFDGMEFPLDNVSHIVSKELAHFQYKINVVPTVFQALGQSHGEGVQSFQYSATEMRQDSDFMAGIFVHPGVFFKYDFSPLLIELRETRQPFTTFITSVCAILGGILTCSGCLNICTYQTAQQIKKLA
jgi:hypothetical protein